MHIKHHAHCTSHRLIDFQQFMAHLSRSHISAGKKIQDNAVVWLLTQCLRILELYISFLCFAPLCFVVF